MKNRYTAALFLLLAGIMAITCSRELEIGKAPVITPDIISFINKTTKASINIVDTMRNDSNGFRVYGISGANPSGWYTDVTGQVLNGTNHHKYSSSENMWNFDPIVRWAPPVSANYPMKFYALYPSTPKGLGVVTSTFSPLFGLSFEYTVQDVGNQEDLLTGVVVTTSQPIDGQEHLSFDHALSIVNFAVIAGIGTTPQIQSLQLANVGDKRNYDFVTGGWTGTASGSAAYTYFGTVVLNGTGGLSTLTDWSPAVKNEIMANPFYTSLTTPKASEAHLMLMPQTSASWTPVSGSFPSAIDGGYVSIIYRMGTGSLGSNTGGTGNLNEVGFDDATKHPNYATLGNGYVGPLYVKAGFPLPATSGVSTGYFSWDKGVGYNYKMGLGTPGSCNGYILDDFYYDDRGNRTALKLIEILREGKRVGDKLQDGEIHVTLSIEPWDDQTNEPAPPDGINVTPKYVFLPHTATLSTPPARSVLVTCVDGLGNPENVPWMLTVRMFDTWLKLSTSPTGTPSSNFVTGSGSGLVYLVADANTGSDMRITELYLNGVATDVAAIIVQDNAGGSPGTPPAGSIPYVGAFWRADETGERVIKMNMGANLGNHGIWGAMIAPLDGRWDPARSDGVLLAIGGSKDSGVTYSSGESPNNAEAYQVSDGIDVISGMVGANQDLIFRIGLQKKFSEQSAYSGSNPNFTSTFPARYGVVVLVYGSPAKAQKIYLRQGHDADYLMRPQDAVSTPGYSSPNRLEARRYSPYNLTVPTAQQSSWGGSQINDHQKLSYEGGHFVQFPTQMGAIFQWSMDSDPRRAFHPLNPPTSSISGWLSTNDSGFWDSFTHETCPPGYRRPKDDYTLDNQIGHGSGAILGSELRQSLWLNPVAGGSNSVQAGNTDNSVWGYYADGFFDRREIVDAISNSPAQKSAVSISSGANHNVAYVGRLFYNPATNANLFFPAGGSRSRTNGALIGSGDAVNYWSNSTSVDHDAWYMGLSPSTAFMANHNKSQTAAVRCVMFRCIGVTFTGITRTPAIGAIDVGSTVTLSAQYNNYTASAPIRWQWQRLVGTEWIDIPGATNATSTFPMMMVGENKFRVVADNCVSSVREISIDGSLPSGSNSTNRNIINGMYVGAFWKSYETEERIIRIPVGASAGNNTGLWIASVVPLDLSRWVADQVLLDTLHLSNSALLSRSINFNAPASPLAPIALNAGTASDIASGVVEENGYILFRMGISHEFFASYDIPARYAIVMLSYANGTKWQKLFLRQGHDPDYVMIPMDDVPLVSNGVTSRLNARRFSPYNLTGTNLDVAVNGITDLTPNNPPKFTDYPTQAGAFFQHVSANRTRYAWNPFSSTLALWTNSNASGYWSALSPTHETCPKDYLLSTGAAVDFHRPSDGSISGSTTVANSSTTVYLNQSEVRTSLYYTPPTGQNNSSIGNSVWGYYADGFFDRRQIVGGPNNNAGSAVMDMTNNNNVAYIGRLFYNPLSSSSNHNASVFFPASGERSTGAGSGTLVNAGVFGKYLSSSTTGIGASTTWTYRMDNSSAYHIGGGSRYLGHPIRCVLFPCNVVAIDEITSSSGINPVPVGNTVTLTVLFNGAQATTPVTWKWQRLVEEVWIDIPGATTSSVTVPIMIIGDNDFRVVANNCRMDTIDEITIEGIVPTGGGSVNQAPNMYVGAFWRAGQKGERIIRIHTGAGATGAANAGLWIASVAPLEAPLWAVDDVLLDRNNLSPSELSARGISFSSLSTPQPAESHFLPASADQLVSGTVAAGDYIEFRIGLNSTFTATNNIPARYAVVVLSYANGTRWHKIFLRQGHDPDYLMLQTDGLTGSTATSRANARRFSPFNATAQNLNARVNGLLDLTPNNAPTFTDFPSQAGAFYQFAQTGSNMRFAWAPVNAVPGWTTTTPAVFWNSLSNDHESCPRGYTLSTGTTVSFYRPSDGPIDATAGTMASEVLMNQSQMRLSLYSVPPTNQTAPTAANMNSVWGYYADGFFDRRWIQTANAVSGSSPVGNDVAYIGRLFYNPLTTSVNYNASIFFPAAGERSTAGALGSAGTQGRYLSSSANGTGATSVWLLHLVTGATGSNQSSGNSRNLGNSLRCVVVPQTPLSGVTLSSVPASGSTMLTGQTIYLTANIAPSGSHVDEYEWLYHDGSTWATIATTTTPTYNTTIMVNGSSQFQVIARNAVNSVTSNIIAVTGFTPLGGSAARITWEEATQRYVLTTDPRDAGLYFRFGSVVGIFSGAGRHTQDLLSTTPNTSPFNAADHVTINVSTVTINSAADVPYHNIPGNNIIDAAYHTPANVKAGRGDPCRLIGLNLENIKNKTSDQLAQLEIDNGTWRLPTGQEQRDFSGYSSNQSGNPGVWWWAQGQNPTNFTLGVAGGEFPARDHVNGGPGKFLPAVGDRSAAGEAGRQAFSTGPRGFFLSNTGIGADFEGFHLQRNDISFTSASRNWFWPARCVRQ